MSFQITALSPSNFQHLFPLSDEELVRHQAVRQTVKSKPGTPCRISLEDAEIGEEVLLVHYEHQPVHTPFKASHAVYVRPGVRQATPAIDAVPQLFRTRILSLRGFDQAGMMVHADLSEGRELEAGIMTGLANPQVAYLHLHFAKPGCYAARVDRA